MAFIDDVKDDLTGLLKSTGCDSFLDAIKEKNQPWEILNELKDEYFRNLRSTWSGSNGQPVYVGKNVAVKGNNYFEGPIIIGDNCTIGPFANVGPYSIILDGCYIGSSEVKRSIILPGTNARHFAYIGDSIIGRNCNLGCGTVLANLRFDRDNVKVIYRGQKIETGRDKFGSILEHDVQTGCNVVLQPGTYICKESRIGLRQSHHISGA